jgi:hypothetical protein
VAQAGVDLSVSPFSLVGAKNAALLTMIWRLRKNIRAASRPGPGADGAALRNCVAIKDLDCAS